MVGRTHNANHALKHNMSPKHQDVKAYRVDRAGEHRTIYRKADEVEAAQDRQELQEVGNAKAKGALDQQRVPPRVSGGRYEPFYKFHDDNLLSDNWCVLRTVLALTPG